MKKRMKSKKLISSLAISTLVLGLLVTTVINADETAAITEPEIQEVEETTEDIVAEEEQEVVEEDTTDEIEETIESDISSTSEGKQIDRSSLARTDLTSNAFPASSRVLELTIITNYDGTNGTTKIDSNGDGYISIGEANAYSGDIILQGKSISGTLYGIENFTSISILNISKNELTGELPENIGNISSLTELRLWGNSLTGEIPSSIGNLSNLTYLSLQSNQLSGAIPSSVGNLSNLQHFYLALNNLNGDIPSTIKNMTNLEKINLSDNQLTGSIPDVSTLVSLNQINLGGNNLSGEVPSSVYSLPYLQEFMVNGNSNLTGNPVTGFASSTRLNYLDIRGSSLIQACPTIPTLSYTVGTFLYDNLASDLLLSDKSDLNGDITQDDINNAQASVEYISDSSIKQQWQDDIDLAQKLLNAKEAVEGLFTDETHTDIVDNLSQDDIDNAQSLVDMLSDGDLKNSLQKEIDKAQDMLDAKNKVDSMFTDETHTSIVEGLTVGNVDDAQVLVDKLPDGTLKDELQKEIDKAKDMLDAKKKVEDLFTDGTHADILDDLTQTDIDDAQKAVDKLPSGDLKDELQKEIDKAQDMLDAKNAVDDLFNDKKDNLADGVTQDDIDKAQDLVNKLPDGSLKDELQKEIDKAQDMLNAKDAANDLLDKDGNLNSGVTQKDIDKVQDLVNKLPDGELKDELQAIIDEAQKQLDEQSNPSVEPPVQKPSVNPSTSSTTGGNSVTTGDETNISLYLGMLVSAAGLVILTKRRKEAK
jgi:LPXTG-motif cell wall-anchored protein